MRCRRTSKMRMQWIFRKFGIKSWLWQRQKKCDRRIEEYWRHVFFHSKIGNSSWSLAIAIHFCQAIFVAKSYIFVFDTSENIEFQPSYGLSKFSDGEISSSAGSTLKSRYSAARYRNDSYYSLKYVWRLLVSTINRASGPDFVEIPMSAMSRFVSILSRMHSYL